MSIASSHKRMSVSLASKYAMRKMLPEYKHPKINLTERQIYKIVTRALRSLAIKKMQTNIRDGNNACIPTLHYKDTDHSYPTNILQWYIFKQTHKPKIPRKSKYK